jgi:hypothetical protein
MAVWLSIGITQNSYDETSHSSVVTATVTAHYSAGAYNATGNAAGTLYINGVPYTFKASFNSSQKESGSEVIYSQTVAIDHTVTNTVDCSATYNSGTMSGTVSASNSKTLSGTQYGGDSGEDEGEYPDYHYTLNYTVGENVLVKFKHRRDASTALRELSGIGSTYVKSDFNPFYLFVEAPPTEHYDTVFTVVRELDGYECAVVTDNYGTYATVEGGRSDNQVYGTYAVVAKLRPKGTVHIDDGEKQTAYCCYVDNGESWDLCAPYVDNGESWDICK